MTTLKRLICLAPMAALLSLACTRRTAPATPAAAAQDQPPVIVRLVARNETITISKGPNGPVYSVHTAKGQPLLSFASREELRLRHPDISHMLDSAIATSAQPFDASRASQLQPAPANITLPALNADGPLMLRRGD